MTQELTIIHQDGLYKVMDGDHTLLVPRANGKKSPIEFQTMEAADGCVRAPCLLEAFGGLKTQSRRTSSGESPARRPRRSRFS